MSLNLGSLGTRLPKREVKPIMEEPIEEIKSSPNFSTKDILEMFNVHDLRVIAAKLGQSNKYGKRSDDKTGLGDTPITKLPKFSLVDIIANLADIIIMTEPGQKVDDDLNTDFILDKFNIGTLRSFVKYIGKQDEIKTFRRIEKNGKIVSENISKSELMEKLKPLVRFGLIIKSGEAGIIVPEIKKPTQQDVLFNELEYQIKLLREQGMRKADIIEKINTALDDAYNDIISDIIPVNNQIYVILKDKQQELAKSGETEAKQRVELRKYIRAAKKYSKDLIDTQVEKLSTIATSGTQELLSQRLAERTEPKQKRQYIKGGAPSTATEIKPVGRPRTREQTTLETKTKRELQRERKVELERQKAIMASEKTFEKFRKQEELAKKKE